MHEYSIVQSLIQSCEGYVEQNRASKVTKVVVKIGVMSGVEPYLLQEAFDTFKEATVCEGCAFEMSIQKVAIECKECGEACELEKNEYLCPACQSGNITVVDGEDMFLMSLELE